MAIEGGLVKVVQGGSAAPGRWVAVIFMGQQQQLLGHRSRDDVPCGREEIHQHRTTRACHLAWNSVRPANLVSRVPSH